MNDVLKAITAAVEKELDRDFDAWLARWTNPAGVYEDAPTPPASRYTTSPERIARVALTAYLDLTREPSEAMVDAGHEIANRMSDGHVLEVGFGIDVSEVWQAMHDKQREELLGK